MMKLLVCICNCIFIGMPTCNPPRFSRLLYIYVTHKRNATNINVQLRLISHINRDLEFIAILKDQYSGIETLNKIIPVAAVLLLLLNSVSIHSLWKQLPIMIIILVYICNCIFEMMIQNSSSRTT